MDREKIESLLAQFAELRAEYAQPDSEVDAGNLYWFACEFEEVIRTGLSASGSAKTREDEPDLPLTFWDLIKGKQRGHMSLPMNDTEALHATIQVLQGAVGSLKQLQGLGVKPRDDAELFANAVWVPSEVTRIILHDFINFIYGKAE